MADFIVLFVTFVPRPGHEERVSEILRGMIDPTRTEPGNEEYELLVSEEPNGRCIYHLLERYTDRSAMEAHRRTEHYAHYRASIEKHLASDIEVVQMRKG